MKDWENTIAPKPDGEPVSSDWEKEEELRYYREQCRTLKRQNAALRQQAETARWHLEQMQNSFFWKITKPIRWLLDRMKHVRALALLLKGIKLLFGRRGLRAVWNRLKNRLPRRNALSAALTAQLTPEEAEQQKNTKFPQSFLISVTVPLYNTPIDFLKDMIRSVQEQTYANWELCLADGSDKSHKEVGTVCQKFAEKDGRIRYRKLDKNLGISGNSNAALAMAKGDYIALLDHDDLLHPAALYEVMAAICEQDADFLYTDEMLFHNTQADAYRPHFKPDFAPDTLRANNYICHLSVFKRSLLETAGGFDPDCDGSQDHDLFLRLTERAQRIAHIPKILYYWRSHAGSVAQSAGIKPYVFEAGIRAVQKQLDRLNLPGTVTRIRSDMTIYRVCYDLTDRPLVSILIPNYEHRKDLERCLDSLYAKTTYPNFEVVIVENNSRSKELFAYYEQLRRAHDNLRVVTWAGAFNYSAVNNFGVTCCRGEYILLLNNDTEVITPEWIEEMLMFAQRPDVGAVGAKLYYPNDTVQHAGVGIGIGGIAGHLFTHADFTSVGYMGRLVYAQNLSAVTAACMLVRRSVWEQVDGLEEAYPVAFNDVDLCMKIRKAGYLIVWTPFAELYHYESKSRGAEDTPEKQRRAAQEVALFQQRWASELAAGDPYLNPNFDLYRADLGIRS